jgi:hypothetical protein
MDTWDIMKPALVSVAGLAPILVIGSSTNGISIEPADLPKVTSLTLSGKGCPSGSTEFSSGGEWNWDGWAISLHRLVVEDSLPSSESTRNSNCQFQVKLSSGPPGWQVGVGQVSLRGFLFLPQNGSMNATLNSSWSQDASPVRMERPYIR